MGIALAALSLAGCANFSGDGGMAPVAARVAADTGQDAVKIADADAAQRAQARVAELLAAPLTADAAAQVALLNNRGLQAAYNAFGIAETAMVEAGLPRNPTVSVERITGSGVVSLEARLAGDLLSFATVPVRRDIGAAQFRAAQHRAVAATLRTAAEARRAFYRAVAAAALAGYLERALVAADAAADLTRRLGETGAAGRLDQARAAAFRAETAAQLARARHAAAARRAALDRALGVWGADADYALPDALPPVPADVADGATVEADAVRRRLDLAIAREDLDLTARALGLTEATRFVSVLELSGIRDTATGEPRRYGFEVALQIPLFDFGEVGVRRARETYLQAVNRLAERAVDVRTQARTAWFAFRAAHDVWRLYDGHILPLRRIVNDEALYRYNGMLTDAFELLTTAREGIAANMAAIEAARDVHLAAVDLQQAVIGGGDGADSPDPTIAVAAPGGAGGH
ncbi:MAG: TolC family protein [Rhodospirillaceae bacterium]